MGALISGIYFTYVNWNTGKEKNFGFCNSKYGCGPIDTDDEEDEEDEDNEEDEEKEIGCACDRNAYHSCVEYCFEADELIESMHFVREKDNSRLMYIFVQTNNGKKLEWRPGLGEYYHGDSDGEDRVVIGFYCERGDLFNGDNFGVYTFPREELRYGRLRTYLLMKESYENMCGSEKEDIQEIIKNISGDKDMVSAVAFGMLLNESRQVFRLVIQFII